jgi:hypothetical protein
LETVKADSRKNAVSVTLESLGERSIIVNKQQPIKQAGQSEEPLKEQEVAQENPPKTVEYGGPKGPEPTRYGDWEQAGRCTDF